MNLQKPPKPLHLSSPTPHSTIPLPHPLPQTPHLKPLHFTKNILTLPQTNLKTPPYNQIQLLHPNPIHLPFHDNSFHYLTIPFPLPNLPH
ncbi:class I SAM-dependent methyltransferase, partial [Bacillus altitudinis]|uniref:class I SAM-dependent methyltransferase n=1 Tax=Bacillus altitudinis TaxID=293387 RepID=UPI003B51B493